MRSMTVGFYRGYKWVVHIRVDVIVLFCEKRKGVWAGNGVVEDNKSKWPVIEPPLILSLAHHDVWRFGQDSAHTCLGSEASKLFTQRTYH